ncbi:hypothetical protein GF362_06065 [Candidatus Dojkabacteria bacterium]|nr:hypothetical protein [Candidatus Dojkabacteria bacterium]
MNNLITVDKNKLRIAVSQFPVKQDIHHNFKYIRKHILYSAQKNADVIHFPETALSGYETDVKTINWTSLDKSLNSIKKLAGENKIYVVLGIHKKKQNFLKPFNSAILISKLGNIVGSYSKNYLYKDELERFSCRSNFFVKKINGIKCGFLICYDSCFPKLFEQYKSRGVKILFLSYHNTNSSKSRNSLDDLMKAQLRTRAADYGMYISGSNSSSRYSRIPSSVASPDGKLVSLERHKPSVLIYDYPDRNLGWTYNNSKDPTG